MNTDKRNKAISNNTCAPLNHPNISHDGRAARKFTLRGLVIARHPTQHSTFQRVNHVNHEKRNTTAVSRSIGQRQIRLGGEDILQRIPNLKLLHDSTKSASNSQYRFHLNTTSRATYP